MYLSLRVTAVVSVYGVIMAVASYGQSVKTDLLARRITFSCHQLPCEVVLRQLEQKESIFFVYSTSVLDLKKTISFTVNDEPLAAVFDAIARQLDLSFKAEGDHIVVKKTAAQVRSLEEPLPKEKKMVRPSLTEKGISNKSKNSSEAVLSSQSFYSSSRTKGLDLGLNQKNSLQCIRAFNLLTPIQRQILLLDSTKKEINIKRGRWFIATGLFINDFSLGGLEIRGGHSYFYGVLNAARTNNNLYRIGYGAGTSLPLSTRFWIGLSYTTAKMTKVTDFAIFTDAVKLTSWHHQIKLSAQYAVSPRINLLAGATFNVLNTRYKFMGEDVSVNVSRVLYRPFEQPHGELHYFQQLDATLMSSNTINAPYTLSNTYSDNHYLNTKTWIGFEVGISYQINFLPSP